LFLFNCSSQDCGSDEFNIKLKVVSGIEIKQKALKGSLIASKQGSSLNQCRIDCGFECKCFIIIYQNNVCKMYNLTAKGYLVSNPNIDPNAVFYYKSDYVVNGRLFLLDSKILILF